jgi:nucleoside-diphosphate-sugar epimerase
MAKTLVTGGAGFIGSHLVDALLARGDEVVVYDNLATGSKENIEHVKGRITFFEEDIRDPQALAHAMKGVDYVLHEAALGSVPRSIADPALSNEVNITGTLNVLIAARDAGVKRLVHASSSSIYGDSDVHPKHEGLPFKPKSPYALNKVAAEEYCRIFFDAYGFETIALRYFNVFGPRQSPKGAYAAVIPLFVEAILNGRRPRINGDGKHSRDFTYVDNVVQANLKALGAPASAAGKAYNAGAGGEYSLLQLVAAINEATGQNIEPEFGPERAGDIKHSNASIDRARAAFGYEPNVTFEEGIRRTVKHHQLAAV